MKVITFIRTLNYKDESLESLAVTLEKNGYVNKNGFTYTKDEVRDLIQPLIETRVTFSKDGFGSCGINREKNPCGDASEY